MFNEDDCKALNESLDEYYGNESPLEPNDPVRVLQEQSAEGMPGALDVSDWPNDHLLSQFWNNGQSVTVPLNVWEEINKRLGPSVKIPMPDRGKE